MSLKHIINGNYGNHTIALIQWAYEQRLEDVTVVSIDTHWAAEAWQARVLQGEKFARQCGFDVVRLKAKPTFQELILDRQEFPSQKFKWCAGFLKGLPLLAWLDEVDPGCQAVIVMGKRRGDSRANHSLPEIIEESEHYNDRKVSYPLCRCDEREFHQLIEKAGFAVLQHRSLECDPCVYSSQSDILRLSEKTIQRVAALENKIGKTMLAKPIREVVQLAKSTARSLQQTNDLERFDMGCGLPFACGE